MEIGFVGLGRMGLNMTIRLLQGGHKVVAFDRSAQPKEAARRHGATTADSLQELIGALAPPRIVWAMIPAGPPVDELLNALEPLLARADLVVDGGNSNYRDSRRRHDALAGVGIQFVDAGTSGGIWGLEVGYCLMVGGDPEPVARLAPALTTLAPVDGWLHAGPPGAGHFAKMVHNGIEYGMMQSYAEGFEILKSSDYAYDLGQLAHLWNQGSVVRSWLLELAELAFRKDPGLERIRGYVEDSGEGRWTVLEAIDRSVPAPVLTLSLLSRFRSRQEDSFRDKVIAALRAEFGGHAVKEKSQ
ncbi:MAG TPA: decarboxylating 6-phosphogluconate dehydrogenase [Candidatus Limnocylindria bacterium]|nr:decarboxylating 6-phosphogluconate dehydrogenase [Candidatus Limnocylindria bacterium]